MAKLERLFIAEKPSLAKGVAEALSEMSGKPLSKGDYSQWVVGEDNVTSVSGHIYDTVDPGEYNEAWKNWSIANLPIEVSWNQWKRMVTKDRKSPDGRTFESNESRLRKINALIKSANRLVNVGDAAREGQLIIDEIFVEAGKDPFAPNVERVWVQSMARKDMIAALSSMKPNSERKALYYSALCRQRADWLHGMNYSRLYTGLARSSGFDTSISVGRVMTPTLRLVVDRDREIARFKPVDHYLPKINFEHEKGTFAASWVIPPDADGTDAEGRLTDKKAAELVCQKVSGKTGKITGYKAETKFTPPPLPYSLSALQADCGAKLGMTAEQVLEVAQSLYETHKATTYPRSDSQYLPTAILKDEAPAIMKALAGVEDLSASKNADMSLRSAAWNNEKVSDHHAIIPTTEFSAAKLARMSDIERKVFVLIARSFIAQFHPPYKYKATGVDVGCEGEKFRATGRVPVDQGWKVVYPKGEVDDEDDKNPDLQALPPMAQGDPVKAVAGKVDAKRTKPPSAFTDGTLITAMVNAHKFETDPELKKRLKEGDGIGTEATRSATITKLLRLKMLDRVGKNGLRSTSFGQSVIDVLPDPLRSLGTTALWEGMLSQVEKGNMDPLVFMEKQSKSIAEHIARARGTTVTIKGASTVRPIEGHGEDCPNCGKGKMVTREIRAGDNKGKKYLSCSAECGYREWSARVEPLPGHGKACPACGKSKLFTRAGKNKEGKEYKGLFCANPECRHVEWPERPKSEILPGDGKPCPTCGKGTMVSRSGISKAGKPYKGLFCSNAPDCSYKEWMDTPRERSAEVFPGDGKTCPVCGKGTMASRSGVSKAGKPYKGLFCSNAPDCTHKEWIDTPKERSSEVLPGDGKTCPVCGKGTMAGRSGTSKAGKPYRGLFCSNAPDCTHKEWLDTPKEEPRGKPASAAKGSSSRR